METKDLALVLFTVLSQASIGAFILLTWLRFQKHDEAMDPVYRKATVVLVPIMAIAMVASLFHLGRPLYALNALRHLSSSWLSREIFCSGAFFVLLLVGVFLEKSVAVERVVNVVAALFGIFTIVSTSAVYDRTMFPAWQGWSTYAAFIGTTVLVGLGLTVGLIAYFGRTVEQATSGLTRLVIAAVIALGVGLVAYPVYLATLGSGGTAAQESLQLLGGRYTVALIVRWAFTLVGGLLPLVLAWRRLSAGKGTTGLLYTALVCMLAGELIGRYLFYATGVPIGIA